MPSYSFRSDSIGIFVLQWLACLQGAEDIRWLISFAFFELAILGGVHFLRYDAEWAEPDYSVRTSRCRRVGKGQVIPVADLFGQ